MPRYSLTDHMVFERGKRVSGFANCGFNSLLLLLFLPLLLRFCLGWLALVGGLCVCVTRLTSSPSSLSLEELDVEMIDI